MGLIRRILRNLGADGIDVGRFLGSMQFSPKFFSDLRAWRKMGGGRIDNIYPILTDFSDSAGMAKGHYFHQDLLVAKEIHTNSPKRHVDIGSRIDGFVAHVASFRQIEVFDIRPLDIGHGISFKQLDIVEQHSEKADSVSCLHSIEHFGLGRYSDAVNPEGHRQGFRKLVELVELGGLLYISFPVSDEPRVEFNAHSVFSTTEVFSWPGSEFLELVKYWLIDDSGEISEGAVPQDKLRLRYGCGVYVFKKIRESATV